MQDDLIQINLWADPDERHTEKTLKLCPRCEQEKPLTQFYKHYGNTRAVCKNCEQPHDRQRRREYALKYPLHSTVSRANTRAKANGLEASLTQVQLQYCLMSLDWCCVICRSKEHLTVDHWIPMSAGGLTRATNIVIMCSRCNQDKWATMPEKWLRQLEIRSTQENYLGIKRPFKAKVVLKRVLNYFEQVSKRFDVDLVWQRGNE